MSVKTFFQQRQAEAAQDKERKKAEKERKQKAKAEKQERDRQKFIEKMSKQATMEKEQTQKLQEELAVRKAATEAKETREKLQAELREMKLKPYKKFATEMTKETKATLQWGLKGLKAGVKAYKKHQRGPRRVKRSSGKIYKRVRTPRGTKSIRKRHGALSRR